MLSRRPLIYASSLLIAPDALSEAPDAVDAAPDARSLFKAEESTFHISQGGMGTIPYTISPSHSAAHAAQPCFFLRLASLLASFFALDRAFRSAFFFLAAAASSGPLIDLNDERGRVREGENVNAVSIYAALLPTQLLYKKKEQYDHSTHSRTYTEYMEAGFLCSLSPLLSLSLSLSFSPLLTFPVAPAIRSCVTISA